MALYAAAVGIVFAVAAATGSIPSPDEARDWGEDLGDFAYVAFVPLFVVANFVITWAILAGAAGLLFGTAVGRRSRSPVSPAPRSRRCWSRAGSPRAITARCSPSERARWRTSSPVTARWR